MKKIQLLFALLLLACCGHVLGQTTYVRSNIDSDKGIKDLEAMKVAFEIMRDSLCTNPTSWYYQGAIHFTPDEINGTNKLCQGYQATKDTLWAWRNCTHEGDTNSTYHFLLWHRVYIWHLEKIVRKYSGKSDFALPYWQYGGLRTPVMPQPFRDPSSSLYTAARLPLLNQGNPVSNEEFKKIEDQISELFKPKIKEFITFSNMLNKSPHGEMHNYIGGKFDKHFKTYNEIFQQDSMKGLMFYIETAGFDPIFWVHHAEIDHLWAIWDGGDKDKRPSKDSLQKYWWPYHFIDPDGNHVEYTLDQVLNIVFNPDYRYDDISPNTTLASNLGTTDFVNEQSNEGESVIWEKQLGLTLGSSTSVHQFKGKWAKKTHATFVSIDPKDKSMILDLDVLIYQEPTFSYAVYFRYEGGEDDYIGTLGFFGAAHEHGTGPDHTIGEAGARLDFSFDITDELKKHKRPQPFEIVVIKSGEGDAKVTIEQARLRVLD